MFEEINRRPVALREAWWSQSLATFLIRIELTPNQISLLSVGFALGGAILLLMSIPHSGNFKIIAFIGCAVCIQLRLLCNMLDGLMAVEGRKPSRLGVLFNDVPDRIADSLFLVTAGYASGGGENGIALGWASGLLAVFSAYIRILGGAQGLKQDFCGPMAKQQRMAVLTISLFLAALEIAFKLPPRILTGCLVLVVSGTFITCVRRVRRLTEALENSSL